MLIVLMLSIISAKTVDYITKVWMKKNPSRVMPTDAKLKKAFNNFHNGEKRKAKDKKESGKKIVLGDQHETEKESALAFDGENE